MFPPAPPCYVLGGRFGDILQMLPCFHEIHRRTGIRPVVISSKAYASVYCGGSLWGLVERAGAEAHPALNLPGQAVADALGLRL